MNRRWDFVTPLFWITYLICYGAAAYLIYSFVSSL